MSAHKAGVLSAALDTAKSARAKNSIEKMLCHQMAACHETGMNPLGRYTETGFFTKLPVADQVRLINAACRTFDVFQAGCLTLQKLQSGGKQHVLVQYQQQVNMSEGGQAVVASKASNRSHRRQPMTEGQP